MSDYFFYANRMGKKNTTAMNAAIERQNRLLERYRKVRVLIIEDGPEARGMLRGIMRDAGVLQIDMAISGQEAIDCLRVRHYDIVLCDYNLGKGKDGQQVLEESRFSQFLDYSSVFIMITAETTVEMVMGALEYQPDSYLSKPYTKNDLMSRLNRALQNKLDYSEIERLFDNKDYQAAITCSDHKIANEPVLPMRAYRIKGECLFQLKQYPQAKALFEEIISLREMPWAKIGLGKTLYYLREFDAAADIFRCLINEQPNVVESYDWLARILIALRQARQSQDVLESAILRSPKAVLRQMELAKVALGNHSYLVAEKAYRKAIGLARESCYHNPDNYLQYVRTLLVKIDHSGSSVCLNAFQEAKVYLARLRKEFDNDIRTNFRSYLLEALVYYTHGQQHDCDKALELGNSLFTRLDQQIQHKLAEEYIGNLTLIGRIDTCQEYIHDLQKNADSPELANRLLQRVQDGKRRLHSENLSNEAMTLYRHGQIIDAYEKFSAAASTRGASANVLLNAVGICIELAEREDLNKLEWRQECSVYLNRLNVLDRCDHRYETFLSYKQRYEELG
ncbi:MAG: response regulator [Pseudomonadales bacterium]|nr:response regulator [Pseudomonadales bacterium]